MQLFFSLLVLPKPQLYILLENTRWFSENSTLDQNFNLGLLPPPPVFQVINNLSKCFSSQKCYKC